MGEKCPLCGERIEEMQRLLRESHSLLGLNSPSSDKTTLQACIRRVLNVAESGYTDARNGKRTEK